jgi:hypothetical protein
MDKFIGKWELEENKNLDKFLEYYGYSWFSIKAALIANVDAYFEKTENPNIVKRTIDSTFIKGTEDYIFDGEFHLTSGNLNKKHNFENDIIYSEVHKENDIWTETVKIDQDKLILKRSWKINNKDLSCTQIFIKKV